MSRATWRNVNFYNGTTGAHLGSLHQNGSITNANFFHMLMDHLLVVETMVTIHFRETGQRMPMNIDRLAIADYDIFVSRGEIKLTEETCVRRVLTPNRSTRDNSFRDAVRARDGKCVFTGAVHGVMGPDDWTSFEASHVFPLGRQQLWHQCGYDHLIKNPGGDPMNSVQNGLLLSSHLHQLFDTYGVSANPDVSQVTMPARSTWNDLLING